jgi:hypothetical protein
MTGECEKWVILRCSARQTLRIAEAVRGEGITAWTPSEVSRPKIPKRRARITLCQPILPRFVFADAARLLELLAMSHRPLAGFTLMADGHRYAVVRDEALGQLRVEESRRERQRLRGLKSQPLQRGKRVSMPKGAWEGLSGIVERSDGRTTKVDLGRFSVEVDTWLLARDGLDAELLAA